MSDLDKQVQLRHEIDIKELLPDERKPQSYRVYSCNMTEMQFLSYQGEIKQHAVSNKPRATSREQQAGSDNHNMIQHNVSLLGWSQQ